MNTKNQENKKTLLGYIMSLALVLGLVFSGCTPGNIPDPNTNETNPIDGGQNFSPNTIDNGPEDSNSESNGSTNGSTNGSNSISGNNIDNNRNNINDGNNIHSNTNNSDNPDTVGKEFESLPGFDFGSSTNSEGFLQIIMLLNLSRNNN